MVSVIESYSYKQLWLTELYLNYEIKNNKCKEKSIKCLSDTLSRRIHLVWKHLKVYEKLFTLYMFPHEQLTGDDAHLHTFTGWILLSNHRRKSFIIIGVIVKSYHKNGVLQLILLFFSYLRISSFTMCADAKLYPKNILFKQVTKGTHFIFIWHVNLKYLNSACYC